MPISQSMQQAFWDFWIKNKTAHFHNKSAQYGSLLDHIMIVKKEMIPKM